jgi:hypothetical protein
MTILCLVMGFMIFGISFGIAEEDQKGSVIENGTYPAVEESQVYLETTTQPTETEQVPADTPVLDITEETTSDIDIIPSLNDSTSKSNEELNAAEDLPYNDLNTTPVLSRKQTSSNIQIETTISDYGNHEVILMHSSPETLTGGYSNMRLYFPLDVRYYNYTKWLPSAKAEWNGDPTWYSAAEEPFVSSGAVWISSQATTEGGNGDTWRLFKADFTIPEGATVTSADLWYSADNAVAVYLNDQYLTSTGSVYNLSDGLAVYSNFYHVNYTPKTGPNTLKFVVRNWKASFYNPTGLIYRSDVVYVPAPLVYTFSITNSNGVIDKTGHWAANGGAQGDIENMTKYLRTNSNWNNVRWNLKFLKEWPDVTKGNFNVNPLSGEDTLNEATLHYHTGHGGSDTAGTYSLLRLLPQESPLLNIDLTPTEVEGKWGGNNKWVILNSCLVLRDPQWGKAFGSSHPTHGIMGYKTESYPRNTFMTTFFEYAKTKPVSQAFLATVQALDSDSMVKSPDGTWEHLTAVTIFSNQTLTDMDYLPGYGSGIQPDTDKNIPAWRQWPKPIDGGV